MMAGEQTPPAEQQPLRLTFPRSRRLTSNQEFAAIYELKLKAADGPLLVFARRNELGQTRIGLSVSRRHGNSVVRHRIRRLLKEAYRQSQHEIPEGLDLILIPLAGRDFSVAAFQKALVRLASKLNRRLEHSNREGGLGSNRIDPAAPTPPEQPGG